MFYIRVIDSDSVIRELCIAHGALWCVCVCVSDGFSLRVVGKVLSHEVVEKE